jgi:hypothetical protein
VPADEDVVGTSLSAVLDWIVSVTSSRRVRRRNAFRGCLLTALIDVLQVGDEMLEIGEIAASAEDFVEGVAD